MLLVQTSPKYFFDLILAAIRRRNSKMALMVFRDCCSSAVT